MPKKAEIKISIKLKEELQILFDGVENPDMAKGIKQLHELSLKLGYDTGYNEGYNAGYLEGSKILD